MCAVGGSCRRWPSVSSASCCFWVCMMSALVLVAAASGDDDDQIEAAAEWTKAPSSHEWTHAPAATANHRPTYTPEEWEHYEQWKLEKEKKERRMLREELARNAPLEIDDKDWWWVVPVLAVAFAVFMLASVKLRRLGGKSVRLWLTKYFSSEKVHHSLGTATAEEFRHQRHLEYGHQFFNFIGCVLLSIVWVADSNRDARLAVMTLTTIQLVLFFVVSVLDCVLLKKGYVRPVRSINTKLRFAHCVYQVVLFCTDAIGGGFSLSLPVDCFIWAIIHYAYEAVACTLEGNNITGLTELAISILVVANLLLSPFAAFGWRLAFGLSCLALSSISILVGAVFKLRCLTHEQHESAAVDFTDHDPLAIILSGDASDEGSQCSFRPIASADRFGEVNGTGGSSSSRNHRFSPITSARGDKRRTSVDVAMEAIIERSLNADNDEAPAGKSASTLNRSPPAAAAGGVTATGTTAVLIGAADDDDDDVASKKERRPNGAVVKEE